MIYLIKKRVLLIKKMHWFRMEWRGILVLRMLVLVMEVRERFLKILVLRFQQDLLQRWLVNQDLVNRRLQSCSPVIMTRLKEGYLLTGSITLRI